MYLCDYWYLSKIFSRFAVVRFCNHLYSYGPKLIRFLLPVLVISLDDKLQ